MDINDANDVVFSLGIKPDQLYSDWFATLTVTVYGKLGGS
jgi:hypothetical protein